MIQFDLISDTHIDFWIKNKNINKLILNIKEIVRDMIPNNHSEILIFAGDIGHSNVQNKIFLEELKKYYNNILVVFGNHDFYLESKSVQRKYKYDSLKRSSEMVEMVTDINGIHFLQGDTITLNGVTFGGTSGWYDFSYGVNILGKTINEIEEVWKQHSGDSYDIKGLPYHTIKMFEKEKERIKKIIDKTDIMITHFPPIYDAISISDKEEDIFSSFYVFNGEEFMNKPNIKGWCFGHIHSSFDKTINNMRFLNNSMGYPSESNFDCTNAIKTIII